MNSDVTLRMSRLDSFVHAWPAAQDGAEVWTATCGVVVPVAEIGESGDGMPCMPCLLTLGTAMADRSGARPWAP